VTNSLDVVGIDMNLSRGLLSLIIGGPLGGVVGALGGWFVFWLKENPDEPAWIFAGTVVGLMVGLVFGSVIGLVLGLHSNRPDLRRPDSDSRPLAL
jgi:hypothetical protein